MAVQLLDDSATREVKDSELPIPDGDPNTIYVIRSITKGKYREVIRRHTRQVPDKQSRKMVDQTDYTAVSDDLFNYALADWRGVTLNGEPVPCTDETRAMLDSVRTSAILDVAGIGAVQEAPERKKESFREPASVA